MVVELPQAVHPLLRERAHRSSVSAVARLAGSAEIRQGFLLMLGESDVTPATSRSTITNSLNSIPEVFFSLNPKMAPGFDYLAPLRVFQFRGTDRAPLFTGDVLTAVPAADDPQILDVAAAGMVDFTEKTTGRMISARVPPLDLIYMLARTSGLAESQVSIAQIDKLPQEVVEIARPLASLVLPRILRFEGVSIIPMAQAAVPLPAGGDKALAAMREEFLSASAVAVTYVSGHSRLHDAELVGLARIERAVDWIRVNSRYGASLWPDGSPRVYRRENARAAIRAEGPVMARGLRTGRTWLRDGEVPSRRAVAEASEVLAPGVLPSGSLVDQLAYGACSRAADDGLEVMARVAALWEALEYYAAGAVVAPLFDRATKRKVKDALPADLSPAQRRRIIGLVDDVNRPPLLARVRAAILTDGAPIAEDEMALLQRLRAVRNDTVHGRPPQELTRQDVEYGVSVVARLLMYRAAASRR